MYLYYNFNIFFRVDACARSPGGNIIVVKGVKVNDRR